YGMNPGRTGACTGFALAAVVNRLIERNLPSDRAGPARRVSPHMLYAMARLYDEWPGEKYEGSSLRGALRGFFNSGACAEGLWPAGATKFGSLAAAKDARTTALGAYYRLRPVLSDYHAAIAETGVIYASAGVHAGWDRPNDGKITPQAGGPLHAFAIVGYDADGFWVQNSWGPNWGKGGLAHWSYEDWAANIQDAWVLQLAVEAPNAFGLVGRSAAIKGGAAMPDVRRARPARTDIAGHFVHFNDGRFSEEQPYWSNDEDVKATAGLVAREQKHRHLLIYAHGGLNTADDGAARMSAMAKVFMANEIYPYGILYDTGLAETLADVIRGRGGDITARTGGLLDLTDDLVENALEGVGKRLWAAMKDEARLPFERHHDGERAIKAFVEALAAPSHPPTSLHVVGHSTGAILVGHLLAAIDNVAPGKIEVATCSLMAPACSIDFYRSMYRPRLGPGAMTKGTKIKEMTIYNLRDNAEQDDTVTRFYNKSLLYLVSNAFEGAPRVPLLGMQKFEDRVMGEPFEICYADAGNPRSRSTTHGGFDNDPATMNDIVRRVLKAAPARPFTDRDLDYG
ncbi:MAG: hypothetical protein AB7S57_25385, partial [Acetobacteraceae bacterium]